MAPTSSPALDYLSARHPSFASTARQSSLYSSFTSLRTNNPDGYTANVADWLSALSLLSRAGLLPSTTTHPSTLILSSSDALPGALTSSRNGQPLSLGAVIDEGVKSGALIPVREYFDRERGIYDTGWRVPGVGEVIRWAARMAGLLSGAGDQLVKGEFVVKESVELVSERVARDLESLAEGGLTERIMDRGEFEKRYRGTLKELGAGEELSGRDMQVLLRYLQRDRPTLAFSDKAVKIAVKRHAPEHVTKEDEGIANVKSLVKSLSEQVDGLLAKITALDKQTRQEIKDGATTKAKQTLRNKRAAENVLNERSKMLETLETTWRGIEVASDNVAIVEAMRQGKDVLKGMNERVGGTHGVDDVMQDLREQLDATEDITTVINEGSSKNIDDADVEDELAALEKDELAKVEARVRAEEQGRAEEGSKEGQESEQAAQEALRRQLDELRVPHAEPERPSTSTETTFNDQLEEKA